MSARAVPGAVALALCALLGCGRSAGPSVAPPRAVRSSADAAVDATAPGAPGDAGRDGGSSADTAWRVIGNGVSERRTDAADGNAVFVALSGWRITDDSVRAWSDALYAARLRALGVRWLYAVRGPAEVDHRSHDLATARLADALLERASAGANTTLVVAHSSGELVAAELFFRLFRERPDGGGALRGRVLFISLDGDADVSADPLRRFEPATVSALRHAWFVTARDPVRGIGALSNATMRAQQRRFADRADFLEYDARDAGCAAPLCVHASLINTRPWPRGNDSYSRFGPEGPNVFWLGPALARWER